MLRRSCWPAVVAALAVAAAPAHADPTQLADASRVNSLDLAGYAAQDAGNNADPDITCGVPTVVGAPVTVATRTPVGETYGIDAAVAHADCLSLQGHSFSATLTLWLQYQPTAGAAFVNVPGCLPGSVTGGSTNGVLAVTTPAVTCTYDVRSAAYDKPHRAYAVLTNTELPTATYPGASAVTWYGGVATMATIGHD
jgi:hypothetical protein